MKQQAAIDPVAWLESWEAVYRLTKKAKKTARKLKNAKAKKRGK